MLKNPHYTFIGAGDIELPDNAPFEQVRGIRLDRTVNKVVVAPFLLNNGEKTDQRTAMKLAGELDFDGHTWRLPDELEAYAIPDRRIAGTPIDANFFPFLKNGGWAWSSLIDADASSFAWLVYLYCGSSYFGDRNGRGLVLAVRSARASQ